MGLGPKLADPRLVSHLCSGSASRVSKKRDLSLADRKGRSRAERTASMRWGIALALLCLVLA
jgi:hypothetical protein